MSISNTKSGKRDEAPPSRVLNDLLPCPFCGRKGRVVHFKGVWRAHYIVKCRTDKCYGNPNEIADYGTEIEAKSAWNQRAR